MGTGKPRGNHGGYGLGRQKEEVRNEGKFYIGYSLSSNKYDADKGIIGFLSEQKTHTKKVC
jgi:hypothetical protein